MEEKSKDDFIRNTGVLVKILTCIKEVSKKYTPRDINRTKYILYIYILTI